MMIGWIILITWFSVGLICSILFIIHEKYANPQDKSQDLQEFIKWVVSSFILGYLSAIFWLIVLFVYIFDHIHKWTKSTPIQIETPVIYQETSSFRESAKKS